MESLNGLNIINTKVQDNPVVMYIFLLEFLW